MDRRRGVRLQGIAQVARTPARTVSRRSAAWKRPPWGLPADRELGSTEPARHLGGNGAGQRTPAAPDSCRPTGPNEAAEVRLRRSRRLLRGRGRADAWAQRIGSEVKAKQSGVAEEEAASAGIGCCNHPSPPRVGGGTRRRTEADSGPG